METTDGQHFIGNRLAIFDQAILRKWLREKFFHSTVTFYLLFPKKLVKEGRITLEMDEYLENALMQLAQSISILTEAS